MSNALNVFVYGTLRPGDCNYGIFISDYAHSYVDAKADGHALYPGAGYPYMLAEDGSTTRGTLVTFTNPDEFVSVIVGLDYLEGFHGPGSARNHYDRKIIDVVTEDGTTVSNVYTYIASRHTSKRVREVLTPVAHGDWLRVISERHETR